MKIEPTIGRIVLFHYPNENRTFAALIAFVHNPNTLNLTVFDHDGMPRGVQNVRLVQEGENWTPIQAWCEWMPYQKSQTYHPDDWAAALAPLPLQAI